MEFGRIIIEAQEEFINLMNEVKEAQGKTPMQIRKTGVKQINILQQGQGHFHISKEPVTVSF